MTSGDSPRRAGVLRALLRAHLRCYRVLQNPSSVPATAALLSARLPGASAQTPLTVLIRLFWNYVYLAVFLTLLRDPPWKTRPYLFNPTAS